MESAWWFDVSCWNEPWELKNNFYLDVFMYTSVYLWLFIKEPNVLSHSSVNIFNWWLSKIFMQIQVRKVLQLCLREKWMWIFNLASPTLQLYCFCNFLIACVSSCLTNVPVYPLSLCVCFGMFVSQIDGSTLRTLCMQHGPLITFHLNLPHGNAVVCYSSKDEAAKAQKSLHM